MLGMIVIGVVGKFLWRMTFVFIQNIIQNVQLAAPEPFIYFIGLSLTNRSLCAYVLIMVEKG